MRTHRTGPKMSQFERNLDHARRFLDGEPLRKLAAETNIQPVSVRKNVYRVLEKAAPQLYDSCVTQRTKDQAQGFNFKLSEYFQQVRVVKEFHLALNELEEQYKKGEIE